MLLVSDVVSRTRDTLTNTIRYWDNCDFRRWYEVQAAVSMVLPLRVSFAWPPPPAHCTGEATMNMCRRLFQFENLVPRGPEQGTSIVG